MVTSNLPRVGHPGRIRLDKDLDEGKLSGILTDSVVMTDNLATVRLIEIDRVIGVLPDMKRVDKAKGHIGA